MEGGGGWKLDCQGTVIGERRRRKGGGFRGINSSCPETVNDPKKPIAPRFRPPRRPALYLPSGVATSVWGHSTRSCHRPNVRRFPTVAQSFVTTTRGLRRRGRTPRTDVSLRAQETEPSSRHGAGGGKRRNQEEKEGQQPHRHSRGDEP